MTSLGLLIVFPFLMAYAAANDLLTMLIPNQISLALVAAFLVVAGASGFTWFDLASHVAAGFLTLSVTFTLFAFRFIGGGDAKLAAATALWFGLEHLADYLLVASVAGGALTLTILVARAQPIPLTLGRLPFAVRLHDAKTGIPYGIALALAALITIPNTLIWSRALAG